MIVGICQLKISIYEAHSLKEKRRILKSLKEKLKNKFNISIAEVGENEKWQTSIIGISIVSNNKKIIESSFDKILNFVETFYELEIIDKYVEIFGDYN